MKVLIFSRDPGGTNAVMQLVEPLRLKGHEVVVYGKDLALSIYRRANIECLDIREAIPAENQEKTDEFVRKLEPDLIVTGTSSEDFTERYLWIAAENAGITSCAVLDQWTNYRLRLIPEGSSPVKEGVEETPLIVPSFLFVMDEFAKQEMAALGIDSDRLVVTGQPFFDYVRETGERCSARQIESLRKELTENQESLVLVFVSQPIVKIHRQNGIAEDHWGYTEKTILESVISCLAKIAENALTKVTLVIRLHPKDEPDAYRGIVEACPESIRAVLDRETDSNLLLKAADLIIGMFSMVLLEAAILERPLISVQIGLKRDNPLVLDRLGVARSILTEKELEKFLRSFVDGSAIQRVPRLSFEFGAVNRIVDHLEANK